VRRSLYVRSVNRHLPAASVLQRSRPSSLISPECGTFLPPATSPDELHPQGSGMYPDDRKSLPSRSIAQTLHRVCKSHCIPVASLTCREGAGDTTWTFQGTSVPRPYIDSPGLVPYTLAATIDTIRNNNTLLTHRPGQEHTATERRNNTRIQRAPRTYFESYDDFDRKV